MKSKLTSRKFWLALIAVISGIMSMWGFGDNTVAAVSGLLLTLLPTITYIITEGKIDAKSLGSISQAVVETLPLLSKSDCEEKM